MRQISMFTSALFSLRGLTCSMLFYSTASLASPSESIWTKEFSKRVVQDAEKKRNIQNGILFVKLRTDAPGKKSITYGLKILRSTGRKAYVEFIAPKEELGRRMLVDGARYLAKFPDSKKAHHISRKEMIVNSVFQIVDLFQFDAVSDFDPMIVEEIGKSDNKLFKVRLNARHDDAPYHAIDYYITKKSHEPVRASFFSFSGKEIKKLEITKWESFDEKRPSQFTMSDSVLDGKASYWTTEKIEIKQIPSTVFTKQHLSR